MKKTLLSLFVLASLVSTAQVHSSNFEPTLGPLSNWTLYNVDAKTPATQVAYVNNAWIQRIEEFDNNVALSTSYYTPAGASNDWMVSPAITLPTGTNNLYWHARSYDPLYKESYKVYVSTTGNAVSNFTTPLLTVNAEEATWQNKSLDLSAYSGQTVYIAFQNFSNDAFLGAIDNVHVINGVSPNVGRAVTTSGITRNQGTINWTAATGATGYDYSFGAVGHIPTVTGTTAAATLTQTFSGLNANLRYQYFVRSKNGATNGGWVGPYSLFTAHGPSNASPYSYGFDNPAAGFFHNDGWSGNWSTNATVGNPQGGAQMAFSNSSTVAATPTNNYLYTRPLHLVAGESYTMTFYLRNFSAAPIVAPQSIALKVGAENTPAAQTTTVWSSTTFAATAWTQFTTTYVPTATGTHYFSFHHTTPGATAGVSLGLDTFNLNTTAVLGTAEIKNVDQQLLIYPNPTSDILNIKTDSKINAVSVVDMTGRKINVKLEGDKVNVSALPVGTYLINVETKDGISTEKFIKK
ncbi:choice-of-anchor J domain-containing protein [Marnyiella aurantia]|uniref:Choice-of-anchor J domain-containing protein n=1 Tax=Marnyiella aurantia TaxID=2758037 RepID=A0A7D7RK61_9FLAO|nr:choice-of-anchor J domain-containing protein [Marnyiella aurantia]MBA5246253.1 choice-of-anchor J domain-containing protein [Marnyiella aurantia]QMS98372.1 choice-of-anchor J domain-containing protein [Marnyiella aurantia]